MANWYCGSVQWTAVTAWAATTAYVVGDLRRQLAAPAVGNERVFRCTTAGTSGGTEPAWNLNNNATTNDGSAVWTNVTGQETYNWAAPFARVAAASAGTGAANGDTFFVAHDHAETQAALLTWPNSGSSGTVGSPNRWICVDTGGSIPPVNADLRTTATVSTTGANRLELYNSSTGYAYVYGISFLSTASTMRIGFAVGLVNLFMENCTLQSSTILIGNAAATVDISLDLNNCPINFTSTGASMYVAGAIFNWRNTASALPGSVPTILFQNTTATSNSGPDIITLDGVDLSALSGNILGIQNANAWQNIFVTNCRLHASLTPLSTTPTRRKQELSIVGSSSTSTALSNAKYNSDGTLTTDTVVYRTGGASDGTTPYSWKIVSTANATATNANAKIGFESFPLATWYTTTGASKTLTVEIISDNVTFTDNEVWVEVEYLGNASYPLASPITDKVALLATPANQATSTASWTSTGIATPVKQKLEVTFTPNLAGLVRAVVKVGKASATLWVDPVLTLA